MILDSNSDSDSNSNSKLYSKSKLGSDMIHVKNEKTYSYNDFKNMFSSITIKKMKPLCRKYNLKLSGNKKQIFYRLSEYLEKNDASIIIQKYFRGYIARMFKHLYLLDSNDNNKPKTNTNTKFANDVDFYSLESFDDIHFYQIFKYKCNKGFVYRFDIRSFFQLYKKSNNGKKMTNPYTREPINRDVVRKFKKYVRFGKCLKYPIILTEEEKQENTQHNPNENTHTHTHIYTNNEQHVNNNDYTNIEINYEEQFNEQQFNTNMNALFFKMDEYGHITDTNWFFQLSIGQKRKYIFEIYDMWNYRLGITHQQKQKIVHPHGNPFRTLFYSIQQVRHIFNERQLNHYIYIIIHSLIHKGYDNESKSLGVFYVLMAFTLVSSDAASSMPWLYQSVVQQ